MKMEPVASLVMPSPSGAAGAEELGHGARQIALELGHECALGAAEVSLGPAGKLMAPVVLPVTSRSWFLSNATGSPFLPDGSVTELDDRLRGERRRREHGDERDLGAAGRRRGLASPDVQGALRVADDGNLVHRRRTSQHDATHAVCPLSMLVCGPEGSPIRTASTGLPDPSSLRRKTSLNSVPCDWTTLATTVMPVDLPRDVDVALLVGDDAAPTDARGRGDR